MRTRAAAFSPRRLVLAAACLASIATAWPAVAVARDRDKSSHARASRIDRDRDGLSNFFELRKSRTSPKRRDTDRDGLRDGYEVKRSKTNPRRADTDRDGLQDGYELRQSQTNPRKWDTDGDGVGDAAEVYGDRDPGTAPLPKAPVPVPPLPIPVPDLTAPETTIDSGPSGTSSSASASFAFSSSESGSTFRCRLDGGAWNACTSPKSYSGLGNGSHTFAVAATDKAGNTDGSPASRTWTVSVSSPPPSGGKNCMADPSACGYPDVETTGVTPGTTLTPVNGTVTLATAGQVYENKLVTGSIWVKAPNVTIRNVKLVATDEWYGIRAFGWQNNVNGLVLDHVEIDLNGKLGIKGVAFDGYTAKNVFFHNGSDCAHMGGNVTIQDSLCVSGPDANDDGWPDSSSFCNGPEHFDGLQSDGGNDIVIRHNTIRNPCSQTSAILMSTNTDGIRDVTIQDNLMAGGGYTLYCNAGPDVPNEVVTGNRFAKTYYRGGGYWGATTGCEDADVFSGNVWDDTNAAM